MSNNTSTVSNVSKAARTYALRALAKKGFRACYLPSSGQFQVTFKGRHHLRSYQQVIAFIKL